MTLLTHPRFSAAVAALAAFILPLPAYGGGPQAGTQPAAWKTVIGVGHADALAIDRRGNPNRAKWGYVANGFNNTVIKFGTGGRRLAAWSYGPQTHYKLGVALAVGGSGNVFVADPTRNRVVKFDPLGRQLAAFDGFNMPRSVALDRQGNIYVAEQNALQVTKLSPSGQILARWHVPWVNGTGSGVPIAVAVDRQGNVYVGVDCYREECPPPHGIQYAVIKLNASGIMQSNLLGNNPYTGITKEEEPFVTVTSLAVDTGGNLYVGGTIRHAQDHFSQGILVYGAGTFLQARYTLPGTDSPVGIAFDGRNNLYVAQGNRVLKHLRSGVGSLSDS